MEEIVSPCISVCKINPETDYCLGCWRTRSEISGWQEASNETRMKIITKMHRRREAAGGRKRRTPETW